MEKEFIELITDLNILSSENIAKTSEMLKKELEKQIEQLNMMEQLYPGL